MYIICEIIITPFLFQNIWNINYFVGMYALFIISFITPCDTPGVLSLSIEESKAYNPCCSYPCLNGGLCIARGDHFICDCSNTGFFGKVCASESWNHLLKRLVHKFAEILFVILQRNRLFDSCDLCHSIFYWLYVPVTIENIRTNILFDSVHEVMMPVYNSCAQLRILPPVPKNCPILGLKEMPPVTEVYNKLLKRDRFQKNRQGLNLLFLSYGLHFNLQFTRCSGINLITCAHIYEDVQRTFKLGMLKTEIILDEEYPVFKKNKNNWIWSRDNTLKDKFLYPNVFTNGIKTIWVREHNKICSLFHQHWPNWNDEHLFRTTKKIITGEMLVITMTEWLSLFGGYKVKLLYKPQFAQYGTMMFANILPLEMNLLLNWSPMLPDKLKLGKNIINLTDSIIRSKPNLIHSNGLYNTFKSWTSSEIGMMCGKNSADSVSEMTKMVILEGRKLRLPSFNQYRTRLGLRKLKEFSELTSSKIIIRSLKELYKSTDALEFIPGVLIEESKLGAVGETLNNLFSNWLFKSLITHPLGSKQLWKPNFLGGSLGWDIIQRANLRDLICSNVNESNECYNENKIGFKIPEITRFLPRTPQRKLYFYSRKKSIFAKSKK